MTREQAAVELAKAEAVLAVPRASFSLEYRAVGAAGEPSDEQVREAKILASRGSVSAALLATLHAEAGKIKAAALAVLKGSP